MNFHSPWRRFFVLAAALALTGCSARSRPSSIERKLANVAKDVVIPFEAEKAANPTPANDHTLAEGQRVYVTHCAMCHSNDGHSQNPLGQAMNPPAMDLTSPHVQSWKDQELYWIISNGIRLTGMPGWQGQLSSEQIWQVARYIHALPQMTPQRQQALEAVLTPPPPPAPKGAAAPSPAQEIAVGRRLLHQEGCLMCHSYQGEGEDVGPDLTDEAARKRTDAWLLGHFKDPPKYTPGTQMPAFDHLTAAQLHALVVMLQTPPAVK